MASKKADNVKWGLIMNNLKESYETPAWLFNYLNNRFHFDLDVAATEANTKCKYFLQNALDYGAEWKGNVFCNPPYSNIMPWIEKACKETFLERCNLAVFVLPMDLSTKWGYYCSRYARNIVFLVGGRVKFVAPGGVKTISNAKGTMIVIFRSRLSRAESLPRYWDIKKLFKRGNNE